MRFKFLVHWLPLALSLVALPFALAGFYLIVTQEDPVVYEQGALDSQEAADVAARALEQAEANNDTADTILGLLEGGSVLLTIIVGVVAFVFTLNLRDLRSDLEGEAEANQAKVDSELKFRAEQMNNALSAREAELRQLTTELTSLGEESRRRVEELTSMITQRLDEARQLAENSFRVLSLQLLAEQQVRARNYDSAISMLLEAHELEPENQTTNYLLGYLYTAQRKFETALDYLETAHRVAPNFAPAQAAIGLAQRRLGDQQTDVDRRNRLWAEAEVNLSKALAMDHALLDGDGESYYGTLGGLYRRQGRYDDAVRAYERAVEVTPSSSYPVGNLAVLYKFTGRDEEAREKFARVERIVESIIEDSPGDYWARFDLAQALLVQGKTDQAFLQYDEIIARKPPVSAFRAAISALQFLAQSPQSVDRLDEAIAMLERTAAKLESTA
ncbi:MAG: tetratricopeptide repeat protein [Chloroflexi bacterium]|nr:tetratricopeptide repeat protein [Chloroflexota bacterium]